MQSTPRSEWLRRLRWQRASFRHHAIKTPAVHDPTEGLAVVPSALRNQSTKMFGLGWIDGPTALRYPLERVTSQHAAAAPSRSLNFRRERIRGPTAVREQQPR